MDRVDGSNSDSAPVKSRKSPVQRYAPLVLVVLLVGLAFVLVSRPTAGRRTTTDTSVTVIVSDAQPTGKAAYPITLQEGGDPEHEADHVFEPLQSVEGVASATLDWSNGLVLVVELDSSVVSAQEVADILTKSGYLEPATSQ